MNLWLPFDLPSIQYSYQLKRCPVATLKDYSAIYRDVGGDTEQASDGGQWFCTFESHQTSLVSVVYLNVIAPFYVLWDRHHGESEIMRASKLKSQYQVKGTTSISDLRRWIEQTHPDPAVALL